jgi:SET domain-containing protein
MRHDIFHEKLYIAPSRISGAGYGVFAKKPLNADELIELAPFIEIPNQVVINLPNRLQDYAFKSHLNPNHVIIIFGYGSIYNHQTHPNVKYVPYIKDPKRFIAFYTLKDVPANEELHVHYGRDPITKKKCKPILP